jgi:hypothetical protein
MSSYRPAPTLSQIGMLGLSILVAGGCRTLAVPATTSPTLAPGREAEWNLTRGTWTLHDGVLEQTNLEGRGVALLLAPALADFVLTLDLRILPTGPGVRAAAIAFRATGTLTYYWAHLDAKNSQVILVHSTPDQPWHEIARRPCPISVDAWHNARLECRGTSIRLSLDGQEILSAEDATLGAGRIGVGTSQGQVQYRNVRIEGEVQTDAAPLREETPPPPLYTVISRGEAAGTYQAFPDACRLQNGDILCAFYAGYGHVSLPNESWPKGGRLCMVRSSYEGRTWTTPEVLFDDGDDNRDPHLTQLRDGSLLCSFFSLYMDGTTRKGTGAQIVRSRDGGKTWSAAARAVAPGHYCSAPVRELPDGTCILGTYDESNGKAWGGVIRSTDQGETWGAAIAIGKDSGVYLDAETDLILRQDGSLYAALRSSKVHMYYATSSDLGLTWSPVQDIGFDGHAPHFTRLSTGEVLLTHRLPQTALHVSRDDCKTWQGPYILDQVIGAYPATVELKDGTILAIYYTEGNGSHVRALRFRLRQDGIDLLPLE